MEKEKKSRKETLTVRGPDQHGRQVLQLVLVEGFLVGVPGVLVGLGGAGVSKAIFSK